MDSIRSYLGMGIKKFIGFQAFELTYLGVLAVLPFIVVQPFIAKTILFVAFLIILNVVYQKLTFRRINTEEKYVFITGCDTGFGNAVARRLSGEGLSVFAGCYNPDGKGASQLRSEYSNIQIIKLDITDDNSVDLAFAEIEKKVGDKGLWALINNAAVYGVGDIEFSPLDEYRRLAEVNIFGLVRVTKKFIPLVRKSKGRIVNVTSNKGRIGMPSNSAFCMTKYGQEGFTDALRMEMKKFGVKVITVEPGNFTGSTAMLSKNKLPTYEIELEKMWQSSPQEVKETYGRSYMDGMIKSIADYSSKSSNSIAPVVNTIEMAVISQNPNQRYLVDGSNSLLDQDNLLIRLGSFLPERVIDFMVDRAYSSDKLLPKEKSA